MKFYEEVEEVIHHRRESLVMLERQNKLSINDDDGANNSKYTVREEDFRESSLLYTCITAPCIDFYVYIYLYFIFFRIALRI